ncbi:hypothetical protein CNMCM5793_009198 [Aspergillus hiratsukae]|uniref:Uncharacterized protein n=1 Tax=Aspergillus hiratsukae TaxID=1194566 RepID=A0A8H6P0X2_9EURO|nr:hypothetical protein CNMCM5793_009198 [Aspergillus hiratsukae]KAF7155671.1 hypothetical protein CNMCM6106_005953 [Aspergillus hiratsukae]
MISTFPVRDQHWRNSAREGLHTWTTSFGYTRAQIPDGELQLQRTPPNSGHTGSGPRLRVPPFLNMLAVWPLGVGLAVLIVIVYWAYKAIDRRYSTSHVHPFPHDGTWNSTRFGASPSTILDGAQKRHLKAKASQETGTEDGDDGNY